MLGASMDRFRKLKPGHCFNRLSLVTIALVSVLVVYLVKNTLEYEWGNIPG